MSASIPLSAQADAVARAAANYRGHRDHIAELVARRKRPQHELDMLEMWLPALQAAAETMHWLVRNEAAVRAAVKGEG